MAKQLVKETVILEPIWENIPNGSKIKGKKDSILFSGRVMKEGGNIYLCQDKLNGSKPNNLLGYKYGYCIRNGKLSDLQNQRIVITSITLDPKFKIPEVFEIAGRTLVFNKGSIQIGCTKITNTTVRKIVKALKD